MIAAGSGRGRRGGQDHPLRIAILAHSTNPRGGVVHALELAEALVRQGHQAVVHAPDPERRGFFRQARCETRAIPAVPVAGGTAELVKVRIADYVRHFGDPAHRRFDVFHAQDGISGNALATLREGGLIGRFARTVHHLDAFHDPGLMALQTRSVIAADRHFVVSRLWQDRLRAEFGLAAALVGNGVDRTRFTPVPDGREAGLRGRLGLDGEAGPLFLSVGGVEPRKNSIGILEAFAGLRAAGLPTARLVIAGGASLLDHQGYRRAFDQALAASRLPAGAVVVTGPLPQADMPALYRIADALVFPSLTEGFGLAVLEAMASHLPVVTARIAPFTEYLGEFDTLWCDPRDGGSIADAMRMALDPALRHCLIANGARCAGRHGWAATAQAHLDLYARLGAGFQEVLHA